MRICKKEMLFQDSKITNRYLWEILPQGAWSGRPCFIVGGGPSLEGFDWNKLKGKRTIGINRAFEWFEPTIAFSMDTRFLNWLLNGMYKQRVSDGHATSENFKNSKAYKVWLLTYAARLPAEFFVVGVLKNYQYGLRHFSMDLKEGIGHGNNSGCAALNLAVCLGANPIYLLGFDCKHKDGKSHFHAGHPMRQQEKTVRDFIGFFEQAYKAFKPYGIQIINLNPDSALPWFPKKRVEEVLH